MNNSFKAYPIGKLVTWGIIGLVGLILIIGLIGLIPSYNGLTTADQKIQNSWGQVEVLLQARADKINNLVEVVKGYVKHEEKVFGDVAAARSTLLNANADISQKLNADAQLTSAARSMLLLVENYPNLKADQQFHDLSIAIEGAENRIAIARKDFNDSVNLYNTKVKTFPGKLYAKLYGFTAKDYFKATPEAQAAPKVKF